MGKDILLHAGIVYPNRTAADFNAIQNKVVMLSPNLESSEQRTGATDPCKKELVQT